MNRQAKIPDPSRFFEIRFESIGGLGAHAAGQILARTAVLHMSLNGAHFSSYGSEKKGSVVRSYVRLSSADKPIRSSAPIDIPDVIVVFHAALLEQRITLAGLQPSGTLICNLPAGEIPDSLSRVPAGTRIVRIDALQIAVEERSRPNAVLLGALTAVLPFLDTDAVLTGLTEGFSHHDPQAVAANERAFSRGGKEFELLDQTGLGAEGLPVMRPTPVWGYQTAPLGGVLPLPGNTVWNDLTASRTGWLPVFNTEQCIHCGLCVLVCPDFCLAWSNESAGDVPALECPDFSLSWSAEGPGEEAPSARLLGIDYRYCKGCLRCVETCPTEAMRREAETPGLAERLQVPLFPEITNRVGGAGGN